MIATAVTQFKGKNGNGNLNAIAGQFEKKFFALKSVLEVAPIINKPIAHVLMTGSYEGNSVVKKHFENNDVVPKISFIGYDNLAKNQDPFAGMKFDYIISLGLSSQPNKELIVKELKKMLANNGALLEDSKIGNTHPQKFACHMLIDGNFVTEAGNFLDDK